MGLFKSLYERHKPQDRYEDKILGPMVLSPDDEAWVGRFKGFQYTIAYGHEPVPDPTLVDYARNMLAASSTLEKAIEQALLNAGASNPMLADEVAGLTISTIHFYSHNCIRRIIADLEGGEDDRSWRAEFAEDHCEGIGFDT